MCVNPYLFFIIAGFLSGSILYSYLLPRLLKQIDITEFDDHNPGAANAFMTAGIPIGTVCVTLDVLKGTLPVYYAVRYLSLERPLFALVLCAPVAGHAFSPLFKGKGGKAIAVSFGVLLGLLPFQLHVVVLAAAMISFSIVLVIRPHRARVICAFGALTVWTLVKTRAVPGVLCGVLLLSAIVIWKHRLREGEAEEVTVSLFRSNPFYTRTKVAFSERWHDRLRFK